MNHAELLRLIETYGYWVIAVGVTVDSFGLPVPGELMLMTAGMYAGATHRISFLLVVFAAGAGAVVGDNSSYLLGRFGGSKLLRRYGYVVHFGSRRQRVLGYLIQRYGEPVVLGGRFLPIIHIGAAFLAGTERMGWPRFAALNAIACLLWAFLLGGAGFLLGKAVLRAGEAFAVISIPLAIVIALVAGIGFHLIEGRIERRIERSDESAEVA